ncbi:unnamed protein product [Parajaminaea phylloscopi]
MLAENGPFSVQNDAQNRTSVTRNKSSWNRASWIVYVDQPSPTGWSTGDVQNADQTDIAAHFASFLANFFKVFTELSSKKLYFVGESYGGTYLPHMIAYLLQDKSHKIPPVEGFAIIDGTIAGEALEEEAALWPFVRRYNQQYLHLSPEVMQGIERNLTQAGEKDYVAQWLKFPPRPEPMVRHNNSYILYDVWNAASKQSPCFRFLDISTKCPQIRDPLGDTKTPEDNWVNAVGAKLRSVVHVPADDKWIALTNDEPFLHGFDPSLKPVEDGTLKRAIEGVKRAQIWHGDLDMRLLTQGVQLGIQNTTWRGSKGFQREPSNPLIGQDGHKRGIWHTERGLTWVNFHQAGHKLPAFEPELSLKAVKILLGHLNESALAQPA